MRVYGLTPTQQALRARVCARAGSLVDQLWYLQEHICGVGEPDDLLALREWLWLIGIRDLATSGPPVVARGWLDAGWPVAGDELANQVGPGCRLTSIHALSRATDASCWRRTLSGAR